MDPFIGFTGAYRDPITHTYPLGNGYRYYCPALMRFNMPDDMSPFGAGGVNPYSYCVGDPINQIDPSGHVGFGVLFKMSEESDESLPLMARYKKDWVKRAGAGDPVPLSMAVHLDKKALPKGTSIRARGYMAMDNTDDMSFEDKDVEAHGSGGTVLKRGDTITLPPVYVDASARDWGVATFPHLIFELYKGSKKKDEIRLGLTVRMVEPDLGVHNVNPEEYAMAAGVSHIMQFSKASQRTSIEARPGAWSGVGPYGEGSVNVSFSITSVHRSKREGGLKNRLLSCVLGRS